MIFKAAPNPARWEGVLCCGWLMVGQLLLLQWIADRSTDWLRFVLVGLFLASIPLLLHLIYRTWAAFSLEYWLDHNSLTVRCADVRETLPFGALRQMVLGGGSEVASPSGWRNWPSQFVRVKPPEDGGVTSLASLPPNRWLLLEGESATWALTPADEQAFATALQQRVRAGAMAGTTTNAIRYERRFDPANLLNVDRLGAILIALGLLGALIVGVVYMVRFPSLPDVLTVRFTGEGLPEVVREKQSLVVLPLLGLLAWGVNGLGGMLMAGRRQISAAYLLWGGTLVVQLCALVSLIGLVGLR